MLHLSLLRCNLIKLLTGYAVTVQFFWLLSLKCFFLCVIKTASHGLIKLLTKCAETDSSLLLTFWSNKAKSHWHQQWGLFHYHWHQWLRHSLSHWYQWYGFITLNNANSGAFFIPLTPTWYILTFTDPKDDTYLLPLTLIWGFLFLLPLTPTMGHCKYFCKWKLR